MNWTILDIVIYGGIGIVLFFALRELFMWYYKINERIELHKETNKLLKELLDKKEETAD